MSSRIELGAGAGVDDRPSWIEGTDADRALSALRDELAWEQREIVLFGRRVRQRHIGLHADDEPELGRDPIVATLCLGATRRFVLAPRRGRHQPRRAFDVEHGSLLVMGGTCQRHYVHGVPHAAGAVGERISLTFRRLLAPPEWVAGV